MNKNYYPKKNNYPTKYRSIFIIIFLKRPTLENKSSIQSKKIKKKLNITPIKVNIGHWS